jgi:uncharacterized repeat protein (TIGR01451 family)
MNQLYTLINRLGHSKLLANNAGICYGLILGLALVMINPLTSYSANKGLMIYPLEKGLVDTPSAVCVNGNDYYALIHKTTPSGQKQDSLIVAKWNGLFWTYLPCPGYQHIDINSNFMTFCDGQLYIAGVGLNTNDSIPTNVLRWDGVKWFECGFGNPISKISSMTSYKNNVYITGRFNYVVALRDSVFAVYKSGKWINIATSHQDSKVFAFNWDDKLYLYGLFNDLNLDKSLHALCEIQDTFLIPINNSYRYIKFLGGADSSLLVRGRDTASKISFNRMDIRDYHFSDLQKLMPQNMNYIDITSSFVFKGKEYLAGLFYKNNVNNYANFMQIDTNSIIPIYATKQRITPFVAIQPQNQYRTIIVKGAFDSFNNTICNNIGTIRNYTGISGFVFNDLNNNCTKDTAEPIYSNKLIQITPGPYYVSTDSNGYYNFIGDSGYYTISLVPISYYSQNCPNTPTNYTLKAIQDTQYSNLNFGITQIPNINDVRVSVIAVNGNKALLGHNEEYFIIAENTGTTTASDIFINLQHSDLISNFKNKNGLLTSNSSSTFKQWKIKSLEAGKKLTIAFSYLIDTATLFYKDSIHFVAYTDSNYSYKDSHPEDNKSILDQIVTSAIDPNDKQSYPAGNISKDLDKIEYTIRFQNTGTAKAIRVVVIDTFDANLAINKVTMYSASHSYLFSVGNHNAMTWTFDNINLPDSGTDQLKSHGFIKFTAALKKGIGAGQLIRNKAHIYFDYQPAIITNQTLNKTILITSSLDPVLPESDGPLKLYPNPSNGMFTIKNTTNHNIKYQLVDLSGKILANSQVPAKDLEELNFANQTTNLVNGVYLLKYEGNVIKVVITK